MGEGGQNDTCGLVHTEGKQHTSHPQFKEEGLEGGRVLLLCAATIRIKPVAFLVPRWATIPLVSLCVCRACCVCVVSVRSLRTNECRNERTSEGSNEHERTREKMNECERTCSLMCHVCAVCSHVYSPQAAPTWCLRFLLPKESTTCTP